MKIIVGLVLGHPTQGDKWNVNHPPIAKFLVLRVAADSTSDSKVQAFFYGRCRANSPSAVIYDNVKQHLSDFLSYLEYTTNLLPTGKQQFCADERGTLSNLMQTLGNDMTPCFYGEESYLPNFLYQSFKSFLSFLCYGNGANIDNFFSSQGQDCRQTLAKSQASEEIGNCFDKIFAPATGVVKKQELCDDISTAHKCFKVTLERHCPNFKAFAILNDDFFMAIRRPCLHPATDQRSKPGHATMSSPQILVILGAFIATKIFLF